MIDLQKIPHEAGCVVVQTFPQFAGRLPTESEARDLKKLGIECNCQRREIAELVESCRVMTGAELDDELNDLLKVEQRIREIVGK